MRSPRTTTKCRPCSPQLEKACTQQRRPNTAKNKERKKFIKQTNKKNTQLPRGQSSLHHNSPLTQAAFPNTRYIIPLSLSSPQASSSTVCLIPEPPEPLCLSPSSLELLQVLTEPRVQREGPQSVGACGCELDYSECLGLQLTLCLPEPGCPAE